MALTGLLFRESRHCEALVNPISNIGWTPIMLTARSCRTEALLVMLEHPGVDLDLKLNNGWG